MPVTEIPCPFCGHGLSFLGPVGRKETCPQCKHDLHACEGCRFFDTSASNQCREAKAEVVRRRDTGNFCDFFEMQDGGPQADGSAEKEATRKNALDDLFKNF